MKRKHLESILSRLKLYSDLPEKDLNISLEQYSTSPSLAADVAFVAEESFQDINGCSVLDLGTGTGILGISAYLLGASNVLAVDIDPNALNIARWNAEEAGAVVDFALLDVLANDSVMPIFTRMGTVDTVLMNPPFGTRRAGADIVFLESATRKYVMKKAKELGAKASVLAELRFNIPKTHSVHRKNTIDVSVDLVRLEKPRING